LGNENFVIASAAKQSRVKYTVLLWIATAALNAALPHGVLLERVPPRDCVLAMC